MDWLQGEYKLLMMSDATTGLPNVNAYLHAFERIAKRSEENVVIAVVVLHIPNLDRIVQVYGECHVQQLQQSLKKHMDSSGYPDFFYFVTSQRDIAVVGSFLTTLDVNEAAKYMKSYFNTPWYYDDFIFFSNVHIGIAIAPVHSEEPLELLRYATLSANYMDKDMHSAIRWFELADKEGMAEKLVTLGEVMAGMENDEFELYFQPQVDIHSKRITSAECLVRWKHPVKGWVGPGGFIPMLEEVGSIYSLDMYIVHLASQAQVRLKEAGFSEMKLGINISGESFSSETLDQEIIDTVEMNGADPYKLVLEVTETVDVLKDKTAIRKLEHLNAYGFQIAIDDFGQGYSSLNYVMYLPVQILKVDKCLVDEYCKDGRIRFMTDKIIEIAGFYDMEVVFEGVEEAEQVEELGKNKGMKGHYQGYHFYRPMNFESFLTLLENSKISMASYAMDIEID